MKVYFLQLKLKFFFINVEFFHLFLLNSQRENQNLMLFLHLSKLDIFKFGYIYNRKVNNSLF